jgi:NAD(P)-dependent dehydrogenase (short-subunit alcohol dehydrogenase family)
MTLEGRVALVTGGSRGIGKAIALGLAADGADVAINYRRDEEAARETVGEVEGLGRKAAAYQASIDDVDADQAMVDDVLTTFGHVDILVNNAGRAWVAPVATMAVEDWRRVLEVNLTGAFLCAQAAGKVMIAQGGGKIINIASVAGLGGARPEVLDSIAYNTSKGGLINFTRDLAVKWGRYKINVNAIAPGWFPSRMSSAVVDRFGERLARDIPLGRIGGDDDLKGAVVYLASRASDYITGQILAVDGGATASGS